MKLRPEWRLLTLGILLAVALTICSHYFDDRGGKQFMVASMAAGLIYLLSVRELLVAPRFPRCVVIFGLLLAVAWNVVFLFQPPGKDDDIHRYVWDGRLQRLGYDPYTVVPADPAVSALHTAETRTLNHPELPSLYPAGSELFFRMVMAIHESIFALKVAFVLCAATLSLLMVDMLRSSKQPTHLVLAYAWNPLLAIEVAGSGHIDILGALFLVASVAALLRGRRAISAAAFGIAIAIKFLPIILLPLYWKRLRLRDAALAIVLIAVIYSPFLRHGSIPVGSLGTYLQSFWFNDPVFAILQQIAPPRLLVGLAVLVGLTTATWIRRTSQNCAPHVFAWPMATSLLFAPVIYPWYLLWLIPFCVSVTTLPIVIWTVSVIPTYAVWHWRAEGRPWLIPGWMMLLEYGAVLASAAIVAAIHRVAGRRLSCKTDLFRNTGHR